MKLNIELGEPMSETAYPSAPENPKRKYYPSFSYSGKGDSEYEFPAEGEMTIRYKKVNETESTDEEGNSRHSCTFEVRSIVGIESEAAENDMPKNHGSATEEALDALIKAHKASKKESY